MFWGVTDAEWLETIVKPHTEGGVPAVFIHCSLHSYRGADTDAWRSLMGARSTSHERARPLKVENLKPHHPIMKHFPPMWDTPNGELYKIEKMWPDAIPLAQAYGQDTKTSCGCLAQSPGKCSCLHDHFGGTTMKPCSRRSTWIW